MVFDNRVGPVFRLQRPMIVILLVFFVESKMRLFCGFTINLYPGSQEHTKDP